MFQKQCNIKTQFSHFVKEEHALEPEQKASLPVEQKKPPCMLFLLASISARLLCCS